MKGLAVVCCALAGCADNGPCQGVSGHCLSFPRSAVEAQIQTAFATAPAGATLAFAAGTFKFSNELTVSADRITVKGAGPSTILDFANQSAGAEGILAMNDGFTISDLAVTDPKGDGIKAVGATGVTYRNVQVGWTSSDGSTHGPYAIYPVRCSNVLVENSTVFGAADAGFYVGQSSQIVVRNNTAQNNVAGILIENSSDSEIYGNMVHDNTAGIMVLALPGLDPDDSHDVSVHDNLVASNNTPYFAVVGDIYGIVPSGTGVFVMSSDNVELYDNTFADNDTANFSVLNYRDSGLMYSDSKFYPYATRVQVHDNSFMGGGTMPDASMRPPAIGALLAQSMAQFPGGKDADMMYDGIVDDTHTSTTGANTMDLCIQNNGDATFLNLHLDELDMTQGLTETDPDLAPYDCKLPAVDHVTFAGLTP